MTCTDVVMAAMEEFGESEAHSVVIIWTNSNAEIGVSSNASRVLGLGMVEAAKDMILRKAD